MSCPQFPVIDVNLDAMRTNAEILCGICAQNGILVAGIIKFSDGDLQVAKAYRDGGCKQLGVSRARHLQALKEAFPQTELLLTRSPTRFDLEACARYADLSLHSDPDVLTALNEEAEKWGVKAYVTPSMFEGMLTWNGTVYHINQDGFVWAGDWFAQQ